MKHLRWAHTSLRLECVWYTKAVRQVERGAARNPVARLPKVAASTRQVHLMVKAAMNCGELEVAALMAVARQFLLRVPSEGIPLEWGGSHSHVSLEPSRAVLTLMSRKNSRIPVTLTRECCCTSSGERVCALYTGFIVSGASRRTTAECFRLRNTTLHAGLRSLHARWGSQSMRGSARMLSAVAWLVI